MLYAIDRALAEGWYSYQLSGIDVFGRDTERGDFGKWYQWTPAPTSQPSPRPWYYKDPPGGDAIVHPFAVALLDKIAPPPPTAIEAYALDPLDPTVLKDKAYNDWYNSLTATEWYTNLSPAEKINFIRPTRQLALDLLKHAASPI